ncbi:hypothetical protein GCM10025794_36840 [Massilia kyonggiensis]
MEASLALVSEDNFSENIAEVLDIRASAAARKLEDQNATKRRQILVDDNLDGVCLTGIGRQAQHAHPELRGRAERKWFWTLQRL